MIAAIAPSAPLTAPVAAPPAALPVQADQYRGSTPPHQRVHGADLDTYRRVYGALGAATGSFASHVAMLAGGTALGVAAGSAVGGPIGGIVGGLAGIYLGFKVQLKTMLGRQIGGRVGGILGDLGGRGASLVGLPLRSDHVDETHDYSFKTMETHLGDINYTHHPHISAAQADAFIAQLKPGDVIVTNDEAATIWTLAIGLVDGKADFNHAILYQGNGKTLESRTVTHGVAEGDLKKVLQHKHHAVAIRPRYTSDAEAQAAVDQGRSMIGIPYDFKFKFGDDSLYCSEFVYKAVHNAAPHVDFKKRAVIGRVAILPGDLLRTSQADVVAEAGRDGTPFNSYLAKFV